MKRELRGILSMPCLYPASFAVRLYVSLCFLDEAALLLGSHGGTCVDAPFSLPVFSFARGLFGNERLLDKVSDARAKRASWLCVLHASWFSRWHVEHGRFSGGLQEGGFTTNFLNFGGIFGLRAIFEAFEAHTLSVWFALTGHIRFANRRIKNTPQGGLRKKGLLKKSFKRHFVSTETYLIKY